MRHYSAIPTVLFAGALAVGVTACGSDAARSEPTLEERARDAADAAAETASDAARDATAAARDIGGAAETVDVKAALLLDDQVDASGINVDTSGTDKVVTLKGSVPTEAQRVRAEQIALREATGYRVENQLTVR